MKTALRRFAKQESKSTSVSSRIGKLKTVNPQLIGYEQPLMMMNRSEAFSCNYRKQVGQHLNHVPSMISEGVDESMTFHQTKDGIILKNHTQVGKA